MKLTTKIIIGFLASLLLMSVVFIIRLSFIDQRTLEFKVNNPNDLTTSPIVAQYKVVKFVNVTDDNANPIANGVTNIVSSNQAKRGGVFYYPKELAPYIRQYINKDTLMVEFNFNSLSIHKRYFYNFDDKTVTPFYLYVNSSTPINVVNKIDMMNLSVKRCVTRELTLSSVKDVLVDSCQIESLHFVGGISNVTLSNSKVKNLNASLEGSSGLETPNSVIEQFNVTGSGQNIVSLSKMNFKKIKWDGKGKDASLSLKMDSTVSTVSFE